LSEPQRKQGGKRRLSRLFIVANTSHDLHLINVILNRAGSEGTRAAQPALGFCSAEACVANARGWRRSISIKAHMLEDA
jgi:hypothetical protein